MKHLAALLSLIVLVSVANADTFVSVKRTNWTPQALGQPQYSTNGTSVISVTWFTNMVPSYEFELRTNVVAAIAAVGKTASEAGFPLGEIITSLIGAIIIAFVKWQQLRQKKLSTVLGQNVETSLEVVEAQPNGKVLASKLKEEIKSQQVDGGVKRLAAEVHDEKVNTVDARAAADRVMA